jgi:hypothetical protein
MSRIVTTRPGDSSPCLPTDLIEDNASSHASFRLTTGVARIIAGSLSAVFD